MITVCTIGVGSEIPFFDLTNQNKQDYCKYHGYEFVNIHHLLDNKKCNEIQRSCWSKFLLMDNIIQDSNYNDFVWWMDADMWIFNKELRLEELTDKEHSLFCTFDNGLNLGIFGMPCTLHSRSILWDWYNRDKWVGHIWGEAMACNEWYHGLFDYRKEVKIIDRKILNTYLHEKNGKCNIVHLVGENKNARYEYFRQCSKGLHG